MDFQAKQYATPFRSRYKGPQDSLTEYRLFAEDYFSGCDMSIHFGNIYIDEITGLQFSIQENTLPLYGYADYLFRTVAHGNRIVQGSFRINFKEAFYLYAVMDSLAQGIGKPTTQEYWNDTNIEEIFSNQYGNYLKGAPPDDAFETIADYYERKMWGANDPVIPGFDFDEILKGRQTSPFFERGSGFTITVGYGPNAAAFSARNKGTYASLLGGMYKPGEEYLPIEETSRRIVGVHIFSCSQISDQSGRPVEEEYSFMARDLDNFDDLILDATRNSE